MKMTKLGYFSEFLLFPTLIVIATLFAFRSSNPSQPVIWATIYGIGLAGCIVCSFIMRRFCRGCTHNG